MAIKAYDPAVRMARREPPDSLDFFPTPPWATRALLERLDRPRNEIVWEPACGAGHMVRPLREHFDVVHATDVHDYGVVEQAAVIDFLLEWNWPPVIEQHGVDWVITNPPYRLSVDFALTALDLVRTGVALLVRTAWLDGGVDRESSRYVRLFGCVPPTEIWQFCDRVPMIKGRCVGDVSTATAYMWVVWYVDGRPRQPLSWLPPCRARLERPGDYDADAGDG